jgi:hypothetical protein
MSVPLVDWHCSVHQAQGHLACIYTGNELTLSSHYSEYAEQKVEQEASRGTGTARC